MNEIVYNVFTVLSLLCLGVDLIGTCAREFTPETIIKWMVASGVFAFIALIIKNS